MGRELGRARPPPGERFPEDQTDPTATQVTTIVAPRAPSDRRFLPSPERFAELRWQQVEEQLRFGEEAFARGDHDTALHHAERAATVDPDSREAIDLIDRARFAIEGKAIRQYREC